MLGGTQSLHTNSKDEALCLPAEESVKLALRTQQVIAHESGVVNTVDPLGGSFYLEHLTDTIEVEAESSSGRSTRWAEWSPRSRAGSTPTHRSAADGWSRQIEQKERIIVGVNAYTDDQPLTCSSSKSAKKFASARSIGSIRSKLAVTRAR